MKLMILLTWPKLREAKLLANYPSSTSSSPGDSIGCTRFSVFSCIPTIQRRRGIAIRIKSFNAELEKITKLGERFLKLQNMQTKEDVSVVRKMKTCQILEPNLVGKETSRASKRILELVLAHKKKKSYKFGILGTGGVGKTTLAQKIYNDEKIKGTFRKQAWICVSQKYSEVALLKEVLRNIGVNYDQDETVGELSAKLAMEIENKSFFLVLDDIWQHGVWTNLLRILLHTASTTVILLTTRNDTVAQAIGVDDVHRIELMSADVGWELLWKSMNISEPIELQTLQGIGMEIVHMCGGLPLAIKVIASVLATKERTESEWRKVINRSAWSMGKLPIELRGALYVSYDELPRCLKQCFLYCALYPENMIMHRDDLVRFWVAEGFVEEEEEQLLEDTAEEYYYELIYRNLLQPVPICFDYSFCKMHDLLRQLAGHLSGEECFCGDILSFSAKPLSKLRRVSIASDKNSLSFPNVDRDHIRVRTLNIRFAKSPGSENTIFGRFSHLRVLNLTGSLIQFIPNSIGNMVHLRSLDLDLTGISYLPESISSLINLQILNLEGCYSLRSLPLGITQLCNLRRIGLRDTPINRVPKGIGLLKNLNDLEGFPIGNSSGNSRMQDGWNLDELDSLLQLRRLDMIKLEKAAHCGVESFLKNKKHLKVLRLWCTEFSYEHYHEEDISRIENIFEQLILPQNLEELVFGGFFGRKFPTWLDGAHLSSVKHLSLVNCRSCLYLPPIGQLPNLKYLEIMGASMVTKIGPEFVRYTVGNPSSSEAIAFPKLESLLMRQMPNLEEWSFIEKEENSAVNEEGVGGGPPENRRYETPEKEKGEAPFRMMGLLPSLKNLYIDDCPNLRALPQQLGQHATSLKELQLRYVGSLMVVENFPFLSQILVIEGCERLERVSNLPQVRRLRAHDCPDLRCVEKLDNLQQLWLDEDMQEISSLWVPRLAQQCRQLHCEDLDISTWTRG
ncbi:hypothetical protein PVAP13_8NG095684 [Panicum virgatum]|uniref:NB-ARC domain-containing protein n=1 Tax=Panicum virgatum TaxID=38727 RepID=A0A8T0PGG1_PANVG|nr:hypothetical protein PVAP13_8NG095684 [Panicum virgatum]KAG2559262.1 hypothetical protein PVAP13_8NG095684 [Panicum virgatum]